jgi:GWxTD domain-containing protein
MKTLLKPFFFSLAIISFFLLAAGCNNSYVENVKRGEGYAYQPGYPELRTEIYGKINLEQQPQIFIAGSIPRSSLIFKKEGDSLQADIDVQIDIKDTESKYSETHQYPVTIKRGLNSTGFEDDLSLFDFIYDVSPGSYKISVSATDKATGKTTFRTGEVILPNLNDKVRSITNIRIFAKQEKYNQRFFPVTTYDVNLSADSLKFQFQLYNSTDNPITLNARLIKFRSDTSHALPMSFVNKSSSSIEYKGIDYRSFETIQSTKRQLNQPGNVTIEFDFKNLTRGNYRFEVGTDLSDREGLYKARDFSIKSENYPSLKSAEELAAPLIYLMNDNEYEDLMSIQSSDSLKAAIDRFWLKNIQNTSLAKNIISLYYQRVEEANKLFANFKEGWKTDMGMVYILFGQPLFQKKNLDQVKWSYNYDLSLPDYTFTFERNKTRSEFFPFYHYILQRSNDYFQAEYRIRELWLSGNIIRATI